MLVRRGDHWLGALGLIYAPRPDTAATVAALRGVVVANALRLLRYAD